MKKLVFGTMLMVASGLAGYGTWRAAKADHADVRPPVAKPAVACPTNPCVADLHGALAKGSDLGASSAVKDGDLGASSEIKGNDTGASSVIKDTDLGAAGVLKGTDLSAKGNF